MRIWRKSRYGVTVDPTNLGLLLIQPRHESRGSLRQCHPQGIGGAGAEEGQDLGVIIAGLALYLQHMHSQEQYREEGGDSCF